MIAHRCERLILQVLNVRNNSVVGSVPPQWGNSSSLGHSR